MTELDPSIKEDVELIKNRVNDMGDFIPYHCVDCITEEEYRVLDAVLRLVGYVTENEGE